MSASCSFARVCVLGNPRLCNGLIAAILTVAWPHATVSVSRRARTEPGRRVEHSKSHYAWPHPFGAGRGLDHHGGEEQHESDAHLAGYLAKRFGMATELGAYLDPLADKAMLVSIYVALGIAEAVPGWLVILVVSRDIMIVSAVILSWLVDKPVALKPLLVSKLNTVAQIALACVIMAARGFEFDAAVAVMLLTALVATLTLISIAFYLAEWVRHMNAAEMDS